MRFLLGYMYFINTVSIFPISHLGYTRIPILSSRLFPLFNLSVWLISSAILIFCLNEKLFGIYMVSWVFCTKHHSNVIIVLVNQNIRSVRRTSIIYLKMTFAQPPPPIPIPTPTPKKENRQKGTKTELLRLLGGFFSSIFRIACFTIIWSRK